MYHKYNNVRFISYNGKERVGKIVGYEENSAYYWIQVKEPINYAIPIESKGKIINWYNQYSTTIDHYVSAGKILGVVVEDIAIAA